MKVLLEVNTKTGEVNTKYRVFQEDALWTDIKLIGETAKLGSQPLKTGRGKRLFNQRIEPIYRERANAWISKCRSLYGHNHNEITVDIEDMVILETLAEICYKL